MSGALASHVSGATRRGGPAALLALVRPPNVLLAAAGVAVGAWWARGESWAAGATWWAVAAAACIAAFVNVANDLADVAIDRVAHPARPLASGAVGTTAARTLAAVAAVGALAASVAAGGVALLLATAMVLVAAVLYSPRLKRHGAAGNVAVALVASLPFAYGAHAVGRLAAGLALVAVAVPLHFARELAKDLEDADADAIGGRVTLPHRFGAVATRRIIALAVVVHIACVMFLLVPAGPRGLALVPALLVAVVAAVRAGRDAAVGGTGAPSLFKLSMLLAMGGLLLLR